MYIFNYIFSPKNAYKPCGIFTIGHFIYLFGLLLVVGIGIYLSRNCTYKQIRKQVFILCIIIDCMEVIKIVYNFAYGYTHVHYWVPLSFCALLLYTSWMSLSRNEIIATIGKLWVVVGGIFGGICFLCYPSTSLGNVQFFHYLAFQSMFYHAVMVYMGLLYLTHNVIRPTINNFKYYAIFQGLLFLVVGILDYIFEINFMFLYRADYLPEFIQAICRWNRPVYSIFVGTGHIVGPFFLLMLVSHVMDSIRASKIETNTNDLVEDAKE